MYNFIIIFILKKLEFLSANKGRNVYLTMKSKLRNSCENNKTKIN